MTRTGMEMRRNFQMGAALANNHRMDAQVLEKPDDAFLYWKLCFRRHILSPCVLRVIWTSKSGWMTLAAKVSSRAAYHPGISP